MTIEHALKRGTLIAALVGGFAAVSEVDANEGRRRHPQGWKVRVNADPVNAKQGLYAFNITVKDETGKRVNDAEVHLQLHSFKEPGYRLVSAKRAGDGWYRGTGQLKPGLEDPRYVPVIVRSAAN